MDNVTYNKSNSDSIGSRTNRGYNMTTISGEPFFPLDPREEDVRIEDIAHALAISNRFNGHTLFPFSVAQHSWIMSFEVPHQFRLEALLHDASEAYCGDLIRPLKVELPEFKTIELRIDDVIRKKFGLPRYMSKEVKEADTRMVWTEKRDIIVAGPRIDWGPPTEPFEGKICEWSWMRAKREFLLRFNTLIEDRRQRGALE